MALSNSKYKCCTEGQLMQFSMTIINPRFLVNFSYSLSMSHSSLMASLCQLSLVLLVHSNFFKIYKFQKPNIAFT